MLPRVLGTVTLLPMAVLTSCRAIVPLGHGWATQSWVGDEPSSLRQEMTIECEPLATVVRADFRVEGASGELQLRLVGPDGGERLPRMVLSGGARGNLTWPASAGIWRLFLESVAFCGSCSLAMEACGAPMVFLVRVVGERSP